jgi:aminoglycoside phosphotransferase (APT) family kinase protein
MVLDQLRPQDVSPFHAVRRRDPAVAELAAVYREELGSEVPELDWFQALACFKSAATWSLIVKHNRRRTPPDPALEAMAAALPQLLSRAGELLG